MWFLAAGVAVRVKMHLRRTAIRPRLGSAPGLLGLATMLAACGEGAGSGTAAGTGTTSEAAGAGAPAVTAGASATGSGSPAAAPSTSSSAAGSTGAAGAAGEGRCPEGMVLVPGGTFRMGSAEDDKAAEPDERPAHDVTLGAYCLDRTEVTVAKYARCVAEPREGLSCSAASPKVVSFGLKPVDVLFWSKFCTAGQAGSGDHPLNCVDWKQADTYCRWAGGRLPTEAEWELGARGTDGRKYPWGNEAPSAERLNACGGECSANGPVLGRRDKKNMYSGNDGAEATSPVGRYPAGASPFGALDMAGNVWEWTADEYLPYAGAPGPGAAGRPAAAPDPNRTVARVVRGGHWLNAGDASPRAANRENKGEEKKLEDIGFRCAASPSR